MDIKKSLRSWYLKDAIRNGRYNGLSDIVLSFPEKTSRIKFVKLSGHNITTKVSRLRVSKILLSLKSY